MPSYIHVCTLQNSEILKKMSMMIGRVIDLAKSNTFRQLMKYGIVGGVGFAIEFSIFFLLNNFWNIQYPFTSQVATITGNLFSLETINTGISHIISCVIAIINNFILNSYFTFKVTNNKLKRFLSFFGIASIGLVISTTLLTFFIEHLGLSDMFGKLLATGIVAMMQFVFNKLFTFKQQ